jgi:hypothetical protein
LAGFGDFGPLFERGPASVPGYLLLLGVRDDTPVAIDQIETAIEASGEQLGQQVVQMLRDLNWRPQLVAAATMLVGRLIGHLPELWSALGRPCWTSPQLAAVASRLDPDFLSNARMRLEVGCKMDVQEALAMSPIARHSALGPTSLDAHSNKLISALTALCSTEEAAEGWLPDIVARPEISHALELDTDHAGSIAVRWRTGMDNLLARSA